MKLRSVITPALAVMLFTTGCSHKIHVSESQATTMSHEAMEILNKSKDTRLPCIKASNKMILKMRGLFAQFEKAQLAENMRTLQPVITDTLIDGVKVYVITPKTIKPENQNRIAYYIHGGGYVMGSATDQTGLIMADELGLKTYSLDYNLAPEAKFPVAMNQALTVYKYLIRQYDPKNMVGYSIVITTSTRDMFLSNSTRLYWKLKAAGVSAQLDVAEGMWHAFTVYKTITESIAARKSAQNFLLRSFNSKTPAVKQSTVSNDTDTNKQLVLRFIDEVIYHQHFELIDKICICKSKTS